MAPEVAADLHQLLHPYDERDIPVPGFPLGEALIAWAHTNQSPALVTALKDVLRSDGFSQQIAVVAVLRSLGVEVDGKQLDTGFVWSLVAPGAPPEDIEPRQQPTRSSLDDVEDQDRTAPSVFRNAFRSLNRAFLDRRASDGEPELV